MDKDRKSGIEKSVKEFSKEKSRIIVQRYRHVRRSLIVSFPVVFVTNDLLCLKFFETYKLLWWVKAVEMVGNELFLSGVEG